MSKRKGSVLQPLMGGSSVCREKGLDAAVCTPKFPPHVQVTLSSDCCSVTKSCLTLAIPWTTAHQASLSIINSRHLLKLMSIESVMPSDQLILCCPHILPSIFPSIRSFLLSQFFASGGQSIGASASVSVLPMNIQVNGCWQLDLWFLCLL